MRIAHVKAKVLWLINAMFDHPAARRLRLTVSD